MPCLEDQVARGGRNHQVVPVIDEQSGDTVQSRVQEGLEATEQADKVGGGVPAAEDEERWVASLQKD